jgi:hypothetical protein
MTKARSREAGVVKISRNGKATTAPPVSDLGAARNVLVPL